MKKKITSMSTSVLIVSIALAVNLCNGFKIGTKALSGSFSSSQASSASSSSAFSHSSSFSSSFNGPLVTNDVGENGAGSAHYGSGAAHSGSGTNFFGSGTGFSGSSAALSSSGAASPGFGAVAGTGNAAELGTAGAVSGATAGAGATAGSNAGSGCSGGGCGGSISKVGSLGLDISSYKVIETPKYNSGYSTGKGVITSVGGQADAGALAGSGSSEGFGTNAGSVSGAGSTADSSANVDSSANSGALSNTDANAAGAFDASGISSGCSDGSGSCAQIPSIDKYSSGNSAYASSTSGSESGSGNLYSSGVETPAHATSVHFAKSNLDSLIPPPKICNTCQNKPTFSGPSNAGGFTYFKPTTTFNSVSSHNDASASSGSGTDSSFGTNSVSFAPNAVEHPIPAAPGDIHTYKPATTVSSGGFSKGTSSAHVSPTLYQTFPGPSGSIHDSKPVSVVSHGAVAGAGANAASAVNTYFNVPAPSYSVSFKPAVQARPTTAAPAVHVAPSLIHSFPGSSGSIHDSKPVSSIPATVNYGANTGATANAGAAATANAGSQTPSGFVSNIPSTHPVVGPSCSYTPGSPNKSCGGAASSTSGSSGLPVLPGSSGSIYDSKPVSSGAVAGAGALADAGAATHSGSSFSTGSAFQSGVSNIPLTHPVVGPSCSYAPGSPNKCGGATKPNPAPGHSLDIIHQFPGASGTIHDSKPVVVGHTAGTSSAATAVTTADNSAHSTGSYVAGHSTNVFHNFPGASGTIHDSKPISSGHVGGVGSGAAALAGAAAVAGAHSTSSSDANSQSGYVHPVVGSSCSYAPGSSNKCGGESKPFNTPTPGHSASVFHKFPGGSEGIHDSKPVSSSQDTGATLDAAVSSAAADAAANANSNAAAGSGSFNIQAPSIHPEAPSSGNTYYVNIPVVPAPHGASFSGQIPCKDNSCGSVTGSEPQKCSFGSSCYNQAGSTSGASAVSGNYASGNGQGSDFAFVDHSKGEGENSYQSLDHDNAHLSGGIVFEKSSIKPTHKNAQSGGYAVSTDDAENAGFVIGPGTGSLPLERDPKPFGSSGFGGGSSAFTKAHGSAQSSAGSGTAGLTLEKDNKRFGTSGFSGDSSGFFKSHGAAHSSAGSFATASASAGASAHAGSFASSF